MMRTISMIVIALGIILSAAGCATLLAGYENTVKVANLPPDAKIYDTNGQELTIKERTEKRKKTVVVEKAVTMKDSTVMQKVLAVVDTVITIDKFIELRSNEDHLLTIRSAEGERKIRRYPKLSAGWFVWGVVTGTFFVDWYTGNWNHFDNIDYRAE